MTKTNSRFTGTDSSNYEKAERSPARPKKAETTHKTNNIWSIRVLLGVQHALLLVVTFSYTSGIVHYPAPADLPVALIVYERKNYILIFRGISHSVLTNIVLIAGLHFTCAQEKYDDIDKTPWDVAAMFFRFSGIAKMYERLQQLQSVGVQPL